MAHPPTAIRLVGVPEHFNRPITACLDARLFERELGEAVEFTTVPGGTGAMMSMLSTGSADVAIALTEGIVSAIVKQRSSCSGDAGPCAPSPPSCSDMTYVCQFVTSPLRWIVATGGGRSDLNTLADLASRDVINVSVSRLGSGSHLMAHVLAVQQGWSHDRLRFTVCKDFRSMRASVATSACDMFMWEQFMTSEYVRSGEVKALGTCTSPWPCFGVASTRDWMAHNAHRLHAVLNLILRQCVDFTRSDRRDAVAEDLCANFNLTLSDAHAWLASVKYADGVAARVAPLKDVLSMLTQLRLLEDASVGGDLTAWATSLLDPTSTVDDREPVEATLPSGASGMVGDLHAVSSPSPAASGDIFTPLHALTHSHAGLGGAHNYIRDAPQPHGAEPAAGYVRARGSSSLHDEAAVRRAAAQAFITAHMAAYGGVVTNVTSYTPPAAAARATHAAAAPTLPPAVTVTEVPAPALAPTRSECASQSVATTTASVSNILAAVPSPAASRRLSMASSMSSLSLMDRDGGSVKPRSRVAWRVGSGGPGSYAAAQDKTWEGALYDMG